MSSGRCSIAFFLTVLSVAVMTAEAMAGIPLIHNSTNIPGGSTKWGGSWGVAGGKYGEFVCLTCHDPGSANIKRVVETIPADMGVVTGAPKPVVFRNVTAFGDDTGGHSSSARICEVCHTQTAVHRYNTDGQADLNHKNGNGTDCIVCHRHSQAFGATSDHTVLLGSTPFSGPNTCLGCHETSRDNTNTASDVYNSVHFQLRTPNPSIDMPGKGSHGMLDRACGLPGTTSMAGNWAGTAISPTNGQPLDDGCGKCHITYKMPYRYPTAADARPDLNCLICHAKVYGNEWEDPAIQAQYGVNPEPHKREVITLADGSKSWRQDRSQMTAKTAGKVETNACLRCHEHGLGGYKRSTPYTAENDVHAAKEVTCTDCHQTKEHKIARGNNVTDGMANEMPEVEVTCTGKCHTSAPHNADNASDLNKHSTNVTCEACHIPTMNHESERSIKTRAWAPFTLNPLSGVWEATPSMTNAEYPGYYDAYTTYYQDNATPAIRWFNGGASMLAQPFGGYTSRASAGGMSKLYAFRPFMNGMLFDAAWLPGPPQGYDHVNNTWHYSMKWFYEQNWNTFKAYGFADASYATAADYWRARPDMAQMLNMMPNMLQFNRAIYLSEAGNVVGTPTPGPQTAATYPGVARAINSGMGSMAIDMGYVPPGTDPIAAGESFWSGSFFGMWVPPNMDPKSPFYGEINSFITMSHGIKGAASLRSANLCSSCHYSESEYAAGTALSKRLDFALLGYPNRDTNGLVDPRYDRTTPDHGKIFAANPFAGPNTCLGCHETSRDNTSTTADVYNSVHFQLRTANPAIDMPGGGSHGMLDRACGLPGTTSMAGNWAGTAISPTTGQPLDDGCGKCHITYKMPYRYPTAADAKPDFDCLICHAKVYGKEWDDPAIQAKYGVNPEPHKREVITLEDGSKSWRQDRSQATAKTAGTKVESNACLRCHEHGLGGYKRSTPFTAENDVHAAKEVKCTDCHQTKDHKIARGNSITDGVANEMPEVQVTCTGKCHTNAPHNADNADALNRHGTNVTCEACHIPTLNHESERSIETRAWAPFTLNPVTGTWQATPSMTNAEYPGYYDAYTTYYPDNAWPAVRWFNGGASMLAQPFGGYTARAGAGGSSKLFAFRAFKNGMLFDAAWLPGPPQGYDHVNSTWPYSMKWFYEQNWNTFKAYGFADASYATAADYWAARPDMAQMLNMMPNMLQFNRAIYLSEAGNVTGTPTPGPQTAANYPGIARAINSGMGSMAIDMGYVPPGTDPIEAGRNFWSGSFFGMWVPPNMDPKSPFYGEINSFITISHGIKGAETLRNANLCYTCHYTGSEFADGAASGPKRLDFALLGYPKKDGHTVADPFYDNPDTCTICHSLAKLQTSGAHAKHIASAPRFYNFTGNRTTATNYDYGCSTCHPMDLANHGNGRIDVTLNKTNTGRGGSVGKLRLLNGATADGLSPVSGPSGIYGTSKVSVRCSAAYCHSNGYGANMKYMTTPDWYGPAYTGDKCAMCHGNSPNANDPDNQPGSPAHYSRHFMGTNTTGGHVVGIHADSIFTGTSGLAVPGNNPTSSHGNADTSTTVNCNICHFRTVTSAANDRNIACASCHNGTPMNPAELIADKRTHISGTPEVDFIPVQVKSKAQLRETSYDKSVWSRQNGYKAPGSHDRGFRTFSTATQWNGATKTCSNVACHNGASIKWTDTGGATKCDSCHNQL